MAETEALLYQQPHTGKLPWLSCAVKALLKRKHISLHALFNVMDEKCLRVQ